MISWLLIGIGVAVAGYWVKTAQSQRGHAGLQAAQGLLSQGYPETAEKRFRVLSRTLNFGEHHERACLGWGTSLEQLGRLDDAIHVYQRYLRLYESTGRGTLKIVRQVKNRLRALRGVEVVAEEPLRARLVVESQQPRPMIRIRENSESASLPRVSIRERVTDSEVVEDTIQDEVTIQREVESQRISQARVWQGHDPANAQRMIGPYMVGDLLGEGGFGEVYKGYLPVAIKFAKSQQAVDKLKKLNDLQGKIRSKRVVKPIAVNLEADPPYVVMEHVDGPTLRDLIRRHERLDPQAAVAVIKEIGLGLHAAHEVGVTHLDLKPENVLVSANGELKITDFELGRDDAANDMLSQSLASISSSSLQGTVAYMSPEQRFGRELDSRSDIYTLGVMLFELLTGELPQPGDRPSDFLPSLPGGVDQIFEKCFTRAERRYQSVSELMTDIEGIGWVLLDTVSLADLVASVPTPKEKLKKRVKSESVQSELTRDEPQQNERELEVTDTRLIDRESEREHEVDQTIAVQLEDVKQRNEESDTETVAEDQDLTEFEKDVEIEAEPEQPAARRPSLDELIQRRASEARTTEIPASNRPALDEVISAEAEERLVDLKERREAAQIQAEEPEAETGRDNREAMLEPNG